MFSRLLPCKNASRALGLLARGQAVVEGRISDISISDREGNGRQFWLFSRQGNAVPRAEEIPASRTAIGHTWSDSFSWMEKKDRRLWDYLRSEQQYFERHLAENLSQFQEDISQSVHGTSSKTVNPPERERIGEYEYFTYTSEERPEDHYMRVHLPSRHIESVLDINELVEDHSNEQLEISQLKVSPSQRLLAYTCSLQSKDDEIIVKEIGPGREIERLSQRIHTLEWLADENSFLYTSMPDGIRPSQVFQHKINTTIDSDTLLHEELNAENFLSLTKSKDGRFLFICSNSKTSSEVFYLETGQQFLRPKLIQSRKSGLEYYVEHFQNQFLILTNADGHTNNCVMLADIKNPSQKYWRILIPEKDAIEDVDVFENFFVLWKRSEGQPAFSIVYPNQAKKISIDCPDTFFSKQGSELHGKYTCVSFKQQPEWGSLNVSLSANADFKADTVSMRVSSPIQEQQTIKFSVKEAEELHRKVSQEASSFNHDIGQSWRSRGPEEKYRCWTETCISEDGTKVPMTIARRKESTAPGLCLLECYGAYGMNLDVAFNPFRLALINRGWTVAYAHVRGGGEKGRKWHHAGRKHGKQQALEDMEACLNFLQQHKLAAPGQVALQATSAGGVIAANLMLKRPTSFGAMVLRMPFLDLFTAMMDSDAHLTQHEWDEWGNPLDPGGIGLLQNLCPYQNLQKFLPSELDSPPVLITAGVDDDRVPIWMPAKWTASLRKKCRLGSQIYLNVASGGHHVGLADAHRLSAIETAFLLDALQR